MARHRSVSSRSPAAVDWKSGRLKGKTVCFTGRPQQLTKKRAAGLVKAEGGRVADRLSADVDFLVVGATAGSGPSRIVSQADKLNSEEQAAIRVIDENGLRDLFLPEPEVLIAMLRAGSPGAARWKKTVSQLWWDAAIDLQQADFRGCTITDVDFTGVNLDGCDFRDAVFAGVTFGRIAGTRFDGCRGFVTIHEAHNCSFRKTSFECHADKRASRLSAVSSNLDGCRLTDVIGRDLSDCSLRRADMSGVTLEQGNLTRSDLSGASLVEASAGYIRAREANFARTDCTRADLMCSIFERASFHKANLTGAVLHNAIFEEADLREACLREADLRWAKLQNADLTGADLTGARLEDADFTGAQLSVAKLTGADLSNATLSEAQIASTTGRVLKEPASGAGGTKIAELEQVALGSRELEVSINVAAGKKSARLTVAASSLWGGSVSGREDLYHEDWDPTSFAGEPTFSGCLLWLRNRWPKSQPDLASLKVVANRCPRQGKELRFLAAAAWCEAFGLPELSEEDFRAIDQAVKAEAARLREIQIAELRGGPEGIRSWNARSYQDRVEPGIFRRVDFSGRKMSRVNLEGVDLQGANFSGATLNFASMSCRDLKQAVFDDVRARSASFHATKLASASFVRAGLQHARFRMSSLQRVSFRNANLRRADFLDADIKEADFTGADLTGAVFDGAKFNELTIFPAGLQLPAGLVWKGTGPDPRSS